MKNHEGRIHRSDAVRDAAVTFLAVVLAFLALDDITTDRATSFTLERVSLAGCAGWFLYVAWRFWQQGQRLPALLSFGLVAIGALANPAIGQDPAPNPLAYLATIAGLAWFLLVAAMLAGAAWLPTNHRPA
jgi:hypothetical protein